MEMMPIVDGLEDDFKGQVSVLQLNAGQATNARLQAQYGLRGHPSFAIIDKNGRIIERYFGPQSEKVLRDAVEIVSDE